MITTQHDMNTADIEDIKSMLNAQVTRMNDFEEQINKYAFSHLNRKKRSAIPDEDQMAAELSELKTYIPKIIQALRALQLEKKIPGPRGPPGQTPIPPRSVIISTPRLVINESQSTILKCSASGYPQPVVAWSKVNGSLPKERFLVDSSGKLELKNATIHDSGTYQCKAPNILGSAVDKSEIEVNFGP